MRATPRLTFIHRWLGAGVPALLISLSASCTAPAIPRASYRTVDTTSPAFQKAVAEKTAELLASGESNREAESRATKIVTRATIASERERRIAEVAPLVRALVELEKPRGCWAYTTTTTTRRDGAVQVDVERFDPFQPEERVWTLVTRDGTTPDERRQAEYRKEKLKRWKRSLANREKRPEHEHVGSTALFNDLTIEARAEGRETAFVFARARVDLPLAGRMEPGQDVYVIDRESGRLLGRRRARGAASFFGTVKVDYFESAMDFMVVEAALAPFVSVTSTRLRIHRFGIDSGDIEIETRYSDYQRVKCYDDRFEVKIGMPQVQDFLPAR